MTATPFEIKLIGKMALANEKIKKIPRKLHAATCPIEGPSGGEKCNCGAQDFNSNLDGIVNDLKVD